QQPRGSSREGEFRIFRDDDRLRRPVAGTHDDASGAARPRFLLEFLFGVCQIARPGIFETGDEGQDSAAVTAQFSTNVIRNLLCRSCHPFLPRYSATARAVLSPCSMHAGTDTPSR